MLSLLFEFGNDLGVSLVLRREKKRRLKINSDRTRIDTEARQKVSDANLYDGMRALQIRNYLLVGAMRNPNLIRLPLNHVTAKRTHGNEVVANSCRHRLRRRPRPTG